MRQFASLDESKLADEAEARNTHPHVEHNGLEVVQEDNDE